MALYTVWNERTGTDSRAPFRYLKTAKARAYAISEANPQTETRVYRIAPHGALTEVFSVYVQAPARNGLFLCPRTGGTVYVPREGK